MIPNDINAVTIAKVTLEPPAHGFLDSIAKSQIMVSRQTGNDPAPTTIDRRGILLEPGLNEYPHEPTIFLLPE
jgi:hypothetical protein